MLRSCSGQFSTEIVASALTVLQGRQTCPAAHTVHRPRYVQGGLCRTGCSYYQAKHLTGHDNHDHHYSKPSRGTQTRGVIHPPFASPTPRESHRHLWAHHGTSSFGGLSVDALDATSLGWSNISN